MILQSRNDYDSSEDFRDEFIETITPGVIKRADFIQWNTIKQKTEQYVILLNFFKQLSGVNKADCIRQISDGLLSADNPFEIIKTAFELLGHTGRTYVSSQDYIDFRLLGKKELDEKMSQYIAAMLIDLGIYNILNLEIDDYFTGVQVGLETHRRKNVGGTAFSLIIKDELIRLVESLKNKGYELNFKEQEIIYFADKKTSKTVDFCLHYRDQSIGIEVNFYTASGSKPTEIKRSYGLVNNELEAVGVTLVWITDGIGYREMRNSLKEARDIHKNTYNFKMMGEYFENDVINLFQLK